MLKTKTYDHIIKRVNKRTGLTNDDCCVKQTKNKNTPRPTKKKKKKRKKIEHKKTKQKTKEKKHVCLYLLQKL